MAEKKKVAVVIGADQYAAGAQSTGNAFNFQEFSNQFYAEGEQQQQQPGEQNHQHHHQQVPDEDVCTSYQVRKTSIVDGLTTQQLANEHRKSLAELNGNPAFDLAELSGVTLSKRHMVTKDEYDVEKVEGQFQQLETFTFEEEPAQ